MTSCNNGRGASCFNADCSRALPLTFSHMARTNSGPPNLKPDLVIVDDMGLKALPKQSGEYLLEVVMRRYENRSTIMTSNRPLEDWGKLLSDVPTAGAILDRFLHHATSIAITGRSYRIKDSLPAASQA